MARYTLLRLLIFFATLMILWLVGLRQIPLLAVSAIVSAIISLVVLQGVREQFANQIDAKVKQRQARAEQHRTAEDDDE
ncbi:DUF4229 domain-containing protein [Luteipulveratus sp. YIM 133132]|uniref:DUF4229 domain-containing protein n=1 Tax=Luteipulveratus flavus TaxID=3031728 RepID=A0ABT6C6W9_9MICO|nr:MULTISPECIES: DUF4229 domain-containing protein [unclassified Luteipulveratus]MDE9365023.1 DUF4229 domain-containing protein [Luteipulveratus sp. YIM 133132]MDF8264637.1 DUF4229 domain-containing protein [Luteipulveratus sp. YIM 133296]